MATKDEQETIRRLVQHVSRAFYEPKYTVILDQLSRHLVLKDDDLAGRIGLQAKELNKLMAVLANDCLVSVFRQNELKEGAQRSVPKQYYYIDYKHFCNVVKWRIAEMRRIIDKTLRNELDTKGYLCPQCSKSFSTLDVDKLVDFATGTFRCDVCAAELVDNVNAESARGAQDRMQRFNAQLRHVRDGLRASEEMVMPAFDVAAYVKLHLVGTDTSAADADGPGGRNGGRGGDRELRIAGAGGGGQEDAGVGVVLSLGVDAETARAERARAAEAKKQQNALPSWHLKSTISGDLTALGVAESARAAASAAAAGTAGPSSSNDAILRGLGTVRPPAAQLDPAGLTVMEDVKPVVDQAGDYYDQYYASLASQSTPGSAPIDDFGEEEEEDVKPSVEYLNSLNDYRKRVRSEDEDASERASKLVKTEADPTPAVNAFGELEVEDEMEGVQFGGAGAADDPVVYVNGEAMAFSAVTEEHQELMTPEEYTAYFEVLSAQS